MIFSLPKIAVSFTAMRSHAVLNFPLLLRKGSPQNSHQTFITAMFDKDLFQQLPEALFRPLASSRQRLNWRVLVRLYHTLFEEDYSDSEYGHSRALVIDAIEAVLGQHGDLWVPDPDDPESGNDIRQRSGLIYRSLRKAGWLDEERRGYHHFVTMAPRVAQCLSALVELSEGRALVVSGALKNMRASMLEILSKPEGQADRLVEMAKDAIRFSRHLGSIKGAIKALYDNIKGDLPARDIVNAFFDDFLSEIFIRDYATIKTTDNPISIKTELLNIIGRLRYDDNKRAVLQAGYDALYPNDALQAKHHLEQDLSRLEQVFANVERQLDAIDTMKVRYEQRVDTVIDYASRAGSQTFSRELGRIVGALARYADKEPDAAVLMPMLPLENIGESRFPVPRRQQPPPKPNVLRSRTVSDEARARIAVERAARRAIQIDDAALDDFLSRQMASHETLESRQLVVETVRDYFCVLNLQRAARMQHAAKRQFPKAMQQYRLQPTEEWVENDFFKMRNVIISKRV